MTDPASHDHSHPDGDPTLVPPTQVQYPMADINTVIETLSRQVGQQASTIAQFDSMIMETRKALDQANKRIKELEGEEVPPTS